MPRVLEVFQVFLKLGLTSFGGPVAHIAFFQRVFVEERQWLDARAYGELVGLCQFLPGPASSQVGFAIGLHRANLPGALAAWLGFTLPSAVIMLMFGAGLLFLDPGDYQGLIQGLKAAAVGVVAWAVWRMGRQLTPDWQRLLIAALAVITAVMLSQLMAWPVLAQIGAILLGAALAPLLLAHRDPEPGAGLSIPFQKRGGFITGGLFVLGILALPLLAWLSPSAWLSIVDAMYRAGALVFGGGHVVLPLLYAETVAQGMLEEDAFLAGYGAAQALPGPLFAFGGFVGTAAADIVIGVLALIALFLPGCLLLLAVLPFWQQLRRNRRVRRLLSGVNAAVVGILAAAFYDPVLTAGLSEWRDGLIAGLVLLGLASGKAPAWAMVIAAGLLGFFWY